VPSSPEGSEQGRQPHKSPMHPQANTLLNLWLQHAERTVVTQPTDLPPAAPELPAAPAPRAEQDGREVLLVELGATRERVSWLLAQNDRLQNELAETVRQARTHAGIAARAQGRALTWRLIGLVAVGLYAIQALARLLPPS